MTLGGLGDSSGFLASRRGLGGFRCGGSGRLNWDIWAGDVVGHRRGRMTAYRPQAGESPG
jgi:hypothetical protein